MDDLYVDIFALEAAKKQALNTGNSEEYDKNRSLRRLPFGTCSL